MHLILLYIGTIKRPKILDNCIIVYWFCDNTQVSIGKSIHQNLKVTKLMLTISENAIYSSLPRLYLIYYSALFAWHRSYRSPVLPYPNESCRLDGTQPLTPCLLRLLRRQLGPDSFWRCTHSISRFRPPIPIRSTLWIKKIIFKLSADFHL